MTRRHASTTLLFLTTALTLSLWLAPGTAGAAGGHGKGMAFGKPGDPAKATRTVTIEMKDNAYSIDDLTVHQGETIRFVLENEGSFVHEFSLGTPDMHKAHQAQMEKMIQSGAMTLTEVNPEGDAETKMAHDDPGTVLVNPDETGELTWTFAKTGNLEFACNVPGHYQAGMVGEITFEMAP